MGMMGKPESLENAVSAPVGALTCVFVERMTRFELATLTLAKEVVVTVRTVRLLRGPSACRASNSILDSPIRSRATGSSSRPASRATATGDELSDAPKPLTTGIDVYGELYSLRSWYIQRVPTVHPWSTSPIRSASGMLTSVMNS